jgi:hypothetical protein
LILPIKMALFTFMKAVFEGVNQMSMDILGL